MTAMPPKLQAALQALQPEDGTRIEEAINQGWVPAERIALALYQLGHPVSASTIRTHRRMRELTESVDWTRE